MAKGLVKTAQRTGPVVDRSGTIPADELSAFMEEDEDEAPSAPAAKAGRAKAGKSEAPTSEAAPASEPVVPSEPVISRLMTGPHKSKFLLLADWFEAAIGGRGTEASVKTNVGAVKFQVIEWIENPGFLKLIVDSEKMPFEPQPLASMTILHRDNAYETTCVSPLSPMFGGLPFAELLLTVDKVTSIEDMEKNARIEPGKTPSAVSGKPSTDVDNDEPVAEGEKAASVKDALPAKDFDVSREP